MCGKLTGVLRAFKRRSKLHGLPAQGRAEAVDRRRLWLQRQPVRARNARFDLICLAMGRSVGSGCADRHCAGKAGPMEVPSHYFAELCEESLTAAHRARDLRQRIAFLEAAIWFAEAAHGAALGDARPKRAPRASLKAD